MRRNRISTMTPSVALGQLTSPRPSIFAARTPDSNAELSFFDTAPMTLPVEGYPSEDERTLTQQQTEKVMGGGARRVVLAGLGC
jgi:hypothetical protein